MFDSLKEGVVSFIDNLKESIGEIIDEITSNVAEFFKPFTDKVKEIYDKVIGFIKDKVDKIKEFFGIPIEPKKQKIPGEDEVKAKAKEEADKEKAAKKPKKKPDEKPASAAPPPPAPTPATAAPSPAPTPAAPPAAAAAAPQAAPAAAQATGPAPSLGSVVQVQSGVDIGGLNPELTKRIAMMASAFKEQTGKTLIVTSGFRSNEKQKQLYDDWKAGRLKAPAVAEPAPPLGKGKGSLHSSGLALDIAAGGPNKAPPDRDLNVLAGTRSSPTGWLEKFGLVRNVPGEDWHVQLAGTPPTADNPQNPGQPVAVPTKTGGAVEVDSGKKESISPVKGPPSTGTQVAAASSDVAAGQRQQAKPSAPVMINASTTNNTKVQKNETVASSKPQNTAGMLAARAA